MPLISTGAALAAALASGVVGGAVGLGQQGWSQGFQAGEADKTRLFSAQEAAKQRDYQALEASKARRFSQMMDSTAYQRRVEDMKKAGLNPALMAGGITGSYAGGSPMASGDGASSAGSVSGAYAPASFDFNNILAKIGVSELINGDQSARKAGFQLTKEQKEEYSALQKRLDKMSK